MRIASWGHAVFAATMIFLGIVGLVRGGFTTTWGGVPKSVPAREALASLCAAVSLLAGVGLIWKRTALTAARLLLAAFLIWLLVFRLWRVVVAPAEMNSWWAAGDTAVMAAAAWALCVRFAGDPNARRLDFVEGDRGLRIARALFGLAMIPFGVAHFWYFKETVAAVPAWMPWRELWAALTGVAFLVAGAAVLAGAWASLAARLTTWQLGLFTLLVWVPVVVAGPDAHQWNEFVASVALTAGAWVVADSYRGAPSSRSDHAP